MVNKRNHPQMAARFRLVKHYNLPRDTHTYIYIYIYIYIYNFLMDYVQVSLGSWLQVMRGHEWLGDISGSWEIRLERHSPASAAKACHGGRGALRWSEPWRFIRRWDILGYRAGRVIIASGGLNFSSKIRIWDYQRPEGVYMYIYIYVYIYMSL